jgi:hypothetical protein
MPAVIALSEAHELVVILVLRVLVAQPHREIGRVAPADAVGGHAARQRADESDLDGILRAYRAGARQQGQRGNECQLEQCVTHGILLLEKAVDREPDSTVSPGPYNRRCPANTKDESNP